MQVLQNRFKLSLGINMKDTYDVMFKANLIKTLQKIAEELKKLNEKIEKLIEVVGTTKKVA